MSISLTKTAEIKVKEILSDQADSLRRSENPGRRWRLFRLFLSNGF